MAYWYAGAMVLSALIGANASEVNQDVENPAPPGGGSEGAGLGPLNTPPQQGDPLQTSLTEILQGGNLPQVLAQGQQAANATGQAASSVQASTPDVPAPGGDAPGDKSKDIKTEGSGDVGQVLAAIPQALAAVDALFAQPNNERTQRAAPVAGGSPGGVVGQFGRPMGQSPDIGRLLASLPGIR